MFSNSSLLSQFVVDSIHTHMLFQESLQPLTYMELDLQREPEEVLNMETACDNFQDIIKLKSNVTHRESEEFIVLAYLEKTGVYQKMRDILFDVYYGKKFPNPLPRICSKLEDFSYKEQADLLTVEDVEDLIYKDDQRVEPAFFGEIPIKDYFSSSTTTTTTTNTTSQQRSRRKRPPQPLLPPPPR